MVNEAFKRILSSIILIPIALFFILKGSYLFSFFILICFLITCYEWHNMSKKKTYHLLGFVFLIVSFFSVHQLIDIGGNYNYFLSILLICVATDLGGYIFGKIFKGPKLTKISPNKTYSGMIGAYFLSILSIYLFFQTKYLFSSNPEITLDILIFILLISTVSQLGDIFVSYFKRLSKIKDTGKIIPGHGGLLDRIDGMIFAFPVAYLILNINIFNYF